MVYVESRGTKMVQALPENSPHLTVDKLQRLADFLAAPDISWRQAISLIWGDENPPKKAELRMFIQMKYGSVYSFRKAYSSTEA